MKVLISGGSGLIGSALIERLLRRDDPSATPHEVLRLVRREPRPGAGEIPWDPEAGRLDPAALEGLDAVVHLAGENIAGGRWTQARKRRLYESRVLGTGLLCRTLARLAKPPRILLSASAIGYYGNRGEEELDETSPPGTGFLARLCRDWEAAAEPAAAAGTRVVLMRTGVVLARHGGALAKMLPLFRLGLGGRLGSGRQYLSWITLEDVAAAIEHLLKVDGLEGPVNLVSPQPATNRDLTAALGRALRRPALLPVPALLLRLAMGDMAEEMLLSSARLLPRRLLAAGFSFGDPELDSAVSRLLRPLSRSPG